MDLWRDKDSEAVVVRKAMLILMAIVVVFPMYWLFMGSLRDAPGMFALPPKLLPTRPTLENFKKALDSDGILRWAVNTVLVSTLSVAGATFVVFTGGWFLANNTGWLPKVVTGLLLASLMVPRQTLLIPMFIEIRHLGLINTIAGAALPIAYAPVATMFARNWLKSAPKVYWEDAQLMGATGWTLFRHVIAPLSAPVLGFVCLMQGIGALSDYLWQSLVLQTGDKLTLYVGLMTNIQMASFQRFPNIQGWRLAISVIMLAPLLLVGILSQRQFKDNIARGISE